MEYGVTQLVVNALPVVSAAISADRGWYGMSDRAYEADAGVLVSERSVLGYAPFWRAVSIITNAVKGLPLDVFRRQPDGGKKYDKKHPAAALLRTKASTWWRSDEMIGTLTTQALIHGNGYGPIDRDALGNPLSIGILDPHNTSVAIMEDGTKWIVTTIRGETIRIIADDVLHIKGLGSNGYCGHSVIDIMRNAFGVGMAAQEFAGRFFSQGSNMSGILMVPNHFSEEKIRNTMSAWGQMQTGLTKSHKIALLQDGVKFQQLTIPPDAAQFLQTREFEVRQTISNITGVPPHMLGDSTRTSHNSLESESQSFLDYCLNPWLREWERETMAKLLTERQLEQDSHVIEFNREAAVSMEFEKKINGIYRQIESGILTRNEGRRLLNLPSAGEDGDEFYRPSNWTEIGEDPPPTAPVSQPQPTEPEEDDTEDEGVDETESMASVLRAMITASVTKDLQIERDRVVQRAAMQGANFVSAVDAFYAGWTTATASGLTHPDARICIMGHANESKRQLLDVAGVSTTGSLKANVADVVSTWDVRGQELIENLMRVVAK